MLQKVLIKEPGDSNLIAGEQQKRDILKLIKFYLAKEKKKFYMNLFYLV